MESKEKFLRLCQKNHWFDGHQRVLLALSGGRDSMTLLSWLTEFQAQLGIEIFCAHVNYGLRAEAAEEERQLTEMLATKNMPLSVAHFPADRKFSENDGRQFRYSFFAEMMKKYDCTALVTAHHEDDNVETLFMREIRGSRLLDLKGIASVQPFATGELIRPLLHFRKPELDAPVFFEDSTNAGTDYFRNRVRNLYLPQLTKENPQLTETLVHLQQEISLSSQLIEETLLPLLAEKMPLANFLKLTEAAQYFTLQLYCSTFVPELQPGHALFDELLIILRRPKQYQQVISANYQLTKTADSFSISALTEKKEPELIILTENPNDDTFSEVNLPADKKYSVRRRESADKLLLHGTHRKLKQFFIDEKIDLSARELPLIAIDSEIYAVPALGIISDLSASLKNDTINQTIWIKLEEENSQNA